MKKKILESKFQIAAMVLMTIVLVYFWMSDSIFGQFEMADNEYNSALRDRERLYLDVVEDSAETSGETPEYYRAYHRHVLREIDMEGPGLFPRFSDDASEAESLWQSYVSKVLTPLRRDTHFTSDLVDSIVELPGPQRETSKDAAFRRLDIVNIVTIAARDVGLNVLSKVDVGVSALAQDASAAGLGIRRPTIGRLPAGGIRMPGRIPGAAREINLVDGAGYIEPLTLSIEGRAEERRLFSFMLHLSQRWSYEVITIGAGSKTPLPEGVRVFKVTVSFPSGSGITEIPVLLTTDRDETAVMVPAAMPQGLRIMPGIQTILAASTGDSNSIDSSGQITADAFAILPPNATRMRLLAGPAPTDVSVAAQIVTFRGQTVYVSSESSYGLATNSGYTFLPTGSHIEKLGDYRNPSDDLVDFTLDFAIPQVMEENEELHVFKDPALEEDRRRGGGR
ncbi:MAG: hypothetical protein NUW37_10680 [Planctomycetes bacterium]|nr:hypothetical protein [Planctomycetota bacterium]